MKAKRILWLYNHVTLIKSEVPILRELGYEVYIPKVIPFDVSITVDWTSDELLSIPSEAVSILNQVDFYDSKIPLKAMEIMNQYFDMVIFGVFIEPLKSLVCKYNGILIFHPFGLEDGMSYTKYIQLKAGNWLLKKIESLGSRFWFGQSYENLYEIECDFFKKRVIDLPIGMYDTTINDKWKGNIKKILFICPRIRVSSYYEKIYRDFKKNFMNIPYSIGGAQPIKVEGDSTVLGYLPKEEFDNLYPSHSVMYYHSTNKRHIHYHPFEAVKNGLPLIYMAGGLLDRLGGEKLPGRCKSLEEAKKKCNRILRGDRRFIHKIRQSQKILLKKMSYGYCKEIWTKSFKKIENETCLLSDVTSAKKKKLALILPQPYKGGVLDYTLRLVKILKKGIELSNDNLEILLAVPYEIYIEYYEVLKNTNVMVRKLKFEEVEKKIVTDLTSLLGNETELAKEKYYLLSDEMNYFEDCDFLLFMSDRVPNNLFLYKPHGVVVHDYIQRYVPDIIGEHYEEGSINLVRTSEANFGTTHWSLQDSVQYAGARKENYHKIPLFFENIKGEVILNEREEKEEYFMWSTNTSKHKNHEFALKGLIEYYLLGGSLKCYVTGVNTELFDPKEKKYKNNGVTEFTIKYIKMIKKIIDRNDCLKKNLIFKGNMSKREYYRLLNGARFILHVGKGDNGNGAVVDAAYLGVPSISSDYPPMRNMNEELKIGIYFFDSNSYIEMSKALFYAQKNYLQMKRNMKENKHLEEHSIDNNILCYQIYKIIKEYTYL